jgi:Methyltransferase domain
MPASCATFVTEKFNFWPELYAMNNNSSAYWEKIYETRNANELSWTQAVPKTSLDFIQLFSLPKNAKIIDVGGGDSNLVDFLLEEGFIDLAVLDISSVAIEKTKVRLGDKARKIKWIVSDILDFEPQASFDLWHDRAAFHFLTNGGQVAQYVDTLRISVGGFVTIGTFSTSGPSKCSGLEIKQHEEASLTKELQNGFEKMRCITEDHLTPFQTKQNFLFCSFVRSSNSCKISN